MPSSFSNQRHYKAVCISSNYDLGVRRFFLFGVSFFEAEFLYLKNNVPKQSWHNFFEVLCLLVNQRLFCMTRCV